VEHAERTLTIAMTRGPVVIGATGGSGTRVVARLARHAGYDLGRNLNEAEDALEFYSFHEKWINRYVTAQLAGGLSKQVAQRMDIDFQSALQRHCPANLRADRHWGWKAPRSIYLLPFLHRHLPNMKFIHVLRDGRDMVLSANQNQLRKHGRAVLTRQERWFRSTAEGAMLLWDRVNLRAAEFSEAELGESYLLVRFEDLYTKPFETTGRIMNFLGAVVDPETISRAEISPPATLQRWRNYPAKLIIELEEIGGKSLRKFGYLA